MEMSLKTFFKSSSELTFNSYLMSAFFILKTCEEALVQILDSEKCIWLGPKKVTAQPTIYYSVAFVCVGRGPRRNQNLSLNKVQFWYSTLESTIDHICPGLGC